MAEPAHDDRAAPLQALRRRRRRLASACFLVAGFGFGTLAYLLRARSHELRDAGKQVTFFALVVVTVAAFWLGARAEAEVGQLDEQLRDLRKR
jgi:hypothetical protein